HSTGSGSSMQRIQRSPPANGKAHELHFTPVIDASPDQHEAQHDAFRARHGSSRPQTTQPACRTIRAVSRPNKESAESTAHIVLSTLRGEHSMRIVTAMRKPAFLLAILII